MREDSDALLTDFYELTMAQGFFRTGLGRRRVSFDLFFRHVPDGGGFAVAAGLEPVVRYLEHLRFSREDIMYLRELGQFDGGFLDSLADFRFSGDISALPEGTPVFPREPILTVTAPAAEAQLLETALLLRINHQSLIATKASRIVRAAAGRPVLEFGARRAQGRDGAVSGARAAYLSGAAATSCTAAGMRWGIPVFGTMAHAWVQMFPDEYSAFSTWCGQFPHDATLLVDTYDTLRRGVPDAIRAICEVLLPQGITDCAIRLDSGDLSYLSKHARRMLDEAGLPFCRIVASGSLDEYVISELVREDAKINAFGVGERLITSRSEPVFGGVYKLTAQESTDGRMLPKIKLSETLSKITVPGEKRLVRFYEGETPVADEMTLASEPLSVRAPHTLFDPDATWKTRTLTDFTARELLVPVFRDGVCVAELPTLAESRDYCLRSVGSLWEELRRLENPCAYPVDLSRALWETREELIRECRKNLS